MSVNKVILLGRLGKDPELTTVNDTSLCKFSIATSEKFTTKTGVKDERTTWHNIIAWGRQAEVMAEFLSKGKEVYIEGRIDNRTYDKKDGTKGYTSEVIVQSFQFVGSTEKKPGGGSPPERNDGYDDDLPF